MSQNNSPEPADEIKSFYWRNHGIAVVKIDDPALPWELKELIVQAMTKRHGTCRHLEEQQR